MCGWKYSAKKPLTIETRDDMILRAIDITLTELEEFFGTANTTYWTWGTLHLVNFPHITGLEPLGYGPIPADGTSFTVCPFSASQIYRDGEIRPTIRSFGASERMILDFSNLSNSISIIPSGQRGISSSIHYIDQLFMYLNGEYHSQHFGADTIEKFQDVWIESTLVIKAGGA